MVSILKPSVSAKEKQSLVNHEHRDILSKQTTLKISLNLFLQRTHLALGGDLGSVHNTRPGQ